MSFSVCEGEYSISGDHVLCDDRILSENTSIMATLPVIAYDGSKLTVSKAGDQRALSSFLIGRHYS